MIHNDTEQYTRNLPDVLFLYLYTNAEFTHGAGRFIY